MSEKERRTKGGEDKNKNERRMREANADVDKDASGKSLGHKGRVKKLHGIDSVRSGYSENS